MPEKSERGGGGVERLMAEGVDESQSGSQSGSQLVSQPDKCGLCAARRPSQYSQ